MGYSKLLSVLTTHNGTDCQQPTWTQQLAIHGRYQLQRWHTYGLETTFVSQLLTVITKKIPHAYWITLGKGLALRT